MSLTFRHPTLMSESFQGADNQAVCLVSEISEFEINDLAYILPHEIVAACYASPLIRGFLFGFSEFSPSAKPEFLFDL